MEKDKKPVYEKITFPIVPNYENVREYLFSKAATDGIAKKFENGDDIERSVEISHYLAQKHFINANKRLERTKKDSQEKRKSMNDQWAELRHKEDSLRDNFIKFDEFVKENQEKRERAANKIIEQEALYEQRQKNVTDLSAKCDEITEIKKQMDKTIGEYRIYENYLKEVILNEPSMQSVADLLKRYEALLSARKELNEMQQRDMVKLEKAKTNLEKVTNNYCIKVDLLKTRLAIIVNTYEQVQKKTAQWEFLHEKIKGSTCDQIQELEKVTNNYCIKVDLLKTRLAIIVNTYEQVQKKTAQWEFLHEKIKGSTCDQIQELVSIRESCQKIYLDICRRKKIKPVFINDYKKQLQCIKDNIGSLEKVNGMVRDLQDKKRRESIEAVFSEKFSQIEEIPKTIIRRAKT